MLLNLMVIEEMEKRWVRACAHSRYTLALFANHCGLGQRRGETLVLSIYVEQL